MGKRHEAALRKKPILQKGAQSLSDAEALNVKGVYFEWKDLIDENHEYHKAKQGFKFSHNGQLYKTAQPEYTFVKQYVPGEVGTESLFTKIDESHAGTLEDPIPAQRNMEYTYFLYYLDPEDGLTYLCQFGDTETQGAVTLAYLPHEATSHFKVVST